MMATEGPERCLLFREPASKPPRQHASSKRGFPAGSTSICGALRANARVPGFPTTPALDVWVL